VRRTKYRRAGSASALVLIAVIAIAPARRAVLTGMGRALVASDEPAPVDFLVMDVESGAAGMLMVGDLYRAHRAEGIGVFAPRVTPLDAEIARRGVVLPDVTRDVLVQLGVPAGAIERIPAGEAGTTETTAALGQWARTHPGKRLLVVVGPSHGRRYRRALRRVWPDAQPPPLVVTTPHALFRAEDWWQSRTTLREGLVEFEKLALDYASHPW
jgi:hypothetical protein